LALVIAVNAKLWRDSGLHKIILAVRAVQVVARSKIAKGITFFTFLRR
jgi:hypothetical protein